MIQDNGGWIRSVWDQKSFNVIDNNSSYWFGQYQTMIGKANSIYSQLMKGTTINYKLSWGNWVESGKSTSYYYKDSLGVWHSTSNPQKSYYTNEMDYYTSRKGFWGDDYWLSSNKEYVCGVRIVVVLKSDVMISANSVGQKTITAYGNQKESSSSYKEDKTFTFNVYDLK